MQSLSYATEKQRSAVQNLARAARRVKSKQALMATPARLPFENSIPCFLRIAKKRQIAAPAGHQKGIFFSDFFGNFTEHRQA